ncbi:hypothetical protein [Endozoicomonas sp. ISHI1]|uniref:hypothetical protein n=5 Tax=Endozoicomonas TaxID=305899 RepID=UPI0021480AF0|nr:hypothetical protein [Endozoicomonas sp. ISHI1]
MPLALRLLKLLPNNRPLASLQRPPLPLWPMKHTHRIDLMLVPPETPEHSSTALIAIGAAGGDDGDKPPDGNHWNPDPKPVPDLASVLGPVQKCLQQKRQLLRMLRIKRQWATMTGQSMLARILSDRIMVIEADLFDLERSGPAMMYSCLVQTWLTENGQELSVYREIAAGKYSGRQAGTGKNGQHSRTTKASTTRTTGQSGQICEVAAGNQKTGSTDGSGLGGDDPLKPSIFQDTGSSVVTCSKCDKALNTQELSRIANELSDPAFLCNKCLSGTNKNKRAKRIREETERDSSEPVQKKNKGSGRKRTHSKAAAGPAAKKKKTADTQIPDDPLEQVKENIHYELSKEELEKAQTLIEICKKKNITVKYTFYKLLRFVERKSFNGFFDNATVFFGRLPESFKNTGMLTSMLNNKKHIRDFAERSQGELEYLASLDVLTSLSSMNNRKGLLKHEEVEEMLSWPEWKDEYGEFNTELFRSFSSMNAKRGIPKHEEVREILSWPEWKDKDGKFSKELFRPFSSMNSSKGILKHEEVKEILSWPEWKGNDDGFNMELFRAYSSMKSGRGMLKHEEMKELLGWPEWKDKDDEFNIELFRAFSSMNCGKGILKHQEVKEVLGWPEWKDNDGEFNMELFRSLSSLYNKRGVPKHKKVREMLGWPEWKDEDDKFNMGLFRSVSSMNHSKGMLNHEEVKEVLSWPEWKDKDDKFNMRLFRVFSSMNNGMGMLKHEEVKEVLGWPEWKDKNGEFNMELFRSLSSMNNGKGMLKHEQVKRVLSWPEWRDKDGEFSVELFRAFSSINSGKGMLKHEKVKEILSWPEWKDRDSKFNMELFRSFASMYDKRGIPKHKEVKDMLSWPEWKDKDDEFSMELFRSFSSMNNRRGMLKHGQVKAMLGWPEWKDKDGEFNMKLFRSFSSMNSCKGIPKHEPVKKVMDWISCGGAPNHQLLRIMTRLWKSEGLPAIQMLQHQETQLKQWLLAESAEDKSDSESEEGDEYDSDSEDEEDDEFNRQIKTVALYLSTSKPDWSLNWVVLQQFQQFNAKTKTVLMMESLITLLFSYGGKGVERYLRTDQKDRDFLWRHSIKTLPLHVLNKAMVLSSSHEHRERFIHFVKRLKSLPDRSRWEQCSALLQPLSGVLKHDYMKRLYWEILQPLTKDDQLRLLDASHAQAVFDLFPSLGALHKLSKEHSPQWLKRLFEACLGLKTHDITEEGIQTLFEALLKTHNLLPWENDIPDHFLSGMRTNSNNNVEIPVSGLITSAEQLALSYIAVLMQNLNEMFFTVKGHWIEVEPLGDDIQIYRYPMPQLKIQDETIAISNWSEEQFRVFLKITGVSEHYYLTADQWQKHLSPDDPVYIQRREARPDGNREPGAKGAVEPAPFKPLPIYVLANIIKTGMAIKSLVWKSLDHHKKRLPESLLGKLKERMETSGTECPDEVKESLSQYLENVRSREIEASEPVSEPEPQNVNPPNDKQEKQVFGSLWLKLNQTEVFGTEILTLLDEYKDEMELMHIVTVLKKAKINISDHILEGWIQRAFSKIKRLKKRDPSVLNFAEDVYQSCQELDLLDECGSIF